MARINSRAKGARAERNLCGVLREEGIGCRRGQQFSGSPDSPDVVLDEPYDWWHIEAKWTERFLLNASRSQALADCGNKMPSVVLRQTDWPWWILLPVKDWCIILQHCDLEELRKHYLG